MKKKLLFTILFLSGAGLFAYFFKQKSAAEPIYIGILRSDIGPFANLDSLIADGVALAIDEINNAGGLLGRPVKAIFSDAKFNSNQCSQEIEKFILKDKVSVIIGGGDPICRRKTKPIVEKYDNLLLYTSLYEGLEESKNIIYLANTPNQQVLPGIWWSINNLGKDFFLLGSNFIYSKIVHEIMKDHIGSLSGKISGEAFIDIDSVDVEEIIDKIVESKAKVLLHTVIGLRTNAALFNALAKKGINAEKIPVMSFTLSEPDAVQLNLKELQGNYATWSYLQCEDTSSDVNGKFIQKFKSKFGKDKEIGDPVEIIYAAIKLWAMAVEKAGTAKPQAVKDSMKGLSIYAPEETIYIDTNNNHAWRSVNIGRFKTDGQFLEVFNSSITVPAIPYPTTRTKEAWDKFIDQLINVGKSNG